MGIAEHLALRCELLHVPELDEELDRWHLPVLSEVPQDHADDHVRHAIMRRVPLPGQSCRSARAQRFGV
jgi:hypothetical protein